MEEHIQIHSDTTLPSFISRDNFVLAETSTVSKGDTYFPLVSANESASGEDDNFVLAETSTVSKGDTYFPLVSANESASGEELGSVNLQSSSP